MGWIIFFSWMFLAVVINVAILFKSDEPEDSLNYKIADKVVTVCMWIGIIGLLILILYVLGWIWYYFCGGFLVFEDQPFWDKVVCGLISLIPLGLFLGIIAIFCGWNPYK